jgi:hypothetical protein
MGCGTDGAYALDQVPTRAHEPEHEKKPDGVPALTDPERFHNPLPQSLVYLIILLKQAWQLEDVERILLLISIR